MRLYDESWTTSDPANGVMTRQRSVSCALYAVIESKLQESTFNAEALSTRRSQRMDIHPNQFSHQIIGAAIEIHRALGPGLLESAYQKCLGRELELRGIPFKPEVWIDIEYKGIQVRRAYRVDFLVARMVAIELKAVNSLTPIDEAQLLTYLKLGGWPLGLLINFNVPVLKDGIRRRVLNLEE